MYTGLCLHTIRRVQKSLRGTEPRSRGGRRPRGRSHRHCLPGPLPISPSLCPRAKNLSDAGQVREQQARGTGGDTRCSHSPLVIVEDDEALVPSPEGDLVAAVIPPVGEGLAVRHVAERDHVPESRARVTAANARAARS